MIADLAQGPARPVGGRKRLRSRDFYEARALVSSRSPVVLRRFSGERFGLLLVVDPTACGAGVSSMRIAFSIIVGDKCMYRSVVANAE